MSETHAFDHKPSFLVATDLSGRSDMAVDRAIQLAARTGGKLHVLHVLNDLAAHHEAEFKDRTRHILEQQIGAARAITPFEAEIHVASGGADSSIIQEARARSIDLVICGHHRMRSGAERWLGSTMDRVLKYGDRPLLIVKTAATKPYAKVVVGTDFSDHATRALDFALRLVPGAEITALHTYHVPYAGMPKPKGVAGAVASGARSEEAEQLDAWLKPLAPLADRAGCKITPVVIHGYAEAIVPARAKDWNSDLVVIGTHGRTGFRHAILGSVAERLISDVPCDVLVVR
jgi:nucleotide-binding universal stress UspA family protein